MKVYISPFFRGEDKGDGGIRRVVEAQVKHLPKYDIELVDRPEDCDVLAVHASAVPNVNKPIVSHCHGLYWDEYNWGTWAHKVNRDVINVMNMAVKVTAPSKWVAESIKRGMAIDAIPVYHGIDISDWEPGTNEGYVLWNKTRVDAVCDPKIVNDLAQLAPKVNFITTFGEKKDNVAVTNTLPFLEAKKIIQNAGMYLCTARETFGIGTLEAMACGVPILGWKWGGQEEFIVNGKHGYLATPGDLQDLYKGLQIILQNREEYSRNCIDTVRREFTWSKAAEKYSQIYKEAYQEEHTPVKVSVIVPLYNLGELLPDTVRSITDQKFDSYEIVIVNDASTDNSLAVAETLCKQDNHIRIINNESNQYLAGALNTGIENSRGKYIIPVDADNMLGENTLKILSDHLDKNQNVHVAYGSMQVVEPDGKRFISGWPGKFYLPAQLDHKNQCPSTSMYRKRIWKRVGGYRRRCRTAEDADFWCRVGSFGGNPQKATDAPTLIYRNRHDSMSHIHSDWPWNKWYTWYNKLELVPYAASIYGFNCSVKSYNPIGISVVIPCGPEHTKYVHDAIDSVVGQTYTDWEIIVVNDSGEEIKNVYPFVKILNTGGVAQGPSVARNIGINAARADTFVLLDADDYLQANALELMYDAYIKNGGYIYCDWFVQETKEKYHTVEYNCKDIIKRLSHAITGLYSKKDWEEVKGFDEHLDAWEDWDYIIALNSIGKCGTRVDVPLFQYRKTTGTVREKFYQKREEALKTIREKWVEYFDGSKELMACGGCRRNNASRPVQPAQSVSKSLSRTVVEQNAVLLEFTKSGQGATTFRGKNNIYRFGSDMHHRTKYVMMEDVEHLLSLGLFKVVKEVESDILEAEGPPKK